MEITSKYKMGKEPSVNKKLERSTLVTSGDGPARNSLLTKNLMELKSPFRSRINENRRQNKEHNRFNATYPKRQSRSRKKMFASFIESNRWGFSISIVTLYALFGEDFRLLVCPKSLDYSFSVFSFIALLIFSIEIAVSVYARKGYAYSFFFWLDIVSSLSIIPDIPFIWDPLLDFFGDSENMTENGMFDASRATKAGTRATRVLRIVRVVRMVRIVKLYKHYRLWTQKTLGQLYQSAEASPNPLPLEGDTQNNGDETRNEPTRIGKKLLESTSKRVISLVLLIILTLPLFDGNSPWNRYQRFGLENLHRMSQDFNYSKSLSHLDMREEVWEYSRNSGKIIYLEICKENCPTIWKNEVINRWLKNLRFQPLRFDGSVDRSAPFTLNVNPANGWAYETDMYTDVNAIDSSFRTEELIKITITGCFLPCVTDLNIRDPWNGGLDNYCAAKMNQFDSPYGVVSTRYSGCTSKAYFDVRAKSKILAGLGILKTIFVIIILGAGIELFQRDANTWVVRPIERMASIVKQLAKDPLATPQIEESAHAKTFREGIETEVIEQTLGKVGALMRVGFGAAGAAIIRQNLSCGHFDPIVPGKLITACYMFCDIRKFTDTTECLQEEVMIYVNKIGELVHGVAVSYYGIANKNVGDAFLLSWKLTDGELPGFSTYSDGPAGVGRGILKNITCPSHAGGGSEKRELTPVEMADSVLAATVKCCNDLMIANVSGNLSVYRNMPSIRQRFGPNFRVNMGFGVHCGWCIEGAIGSWYKIDCTYVSPHVDMADRLEAGSKRYNTPINISHWLVGLLSPQAKKLLRPIDRVTIPGLYNEDKHHHEGAAKYKKVPIPMTIYTFDVTDPIPGFLEPEYEENCRSTLRNGKRRECVPLRKKQLPIKWGHPKVMRQVSNIRRSIPRKFYDKYRSGVNAYIQGDWATARKMLIQAKQNYPQDGPCQHLLAYMESAKNEAPANWTSTFHEIPDF